MMPSEASTSSPMLNHNSKDYFITSVEGTGQVPTYRCADKQQEAFTTVWNETIQWSLQEAQEVVCLSSAGNKSK